MIALEEYRALTWRVMESSRNRSQWGDAHQTNEGVTVDRGLCSLVPLFADGCAALELSRDQLQSFRTMTVSDNSTVTTFRALQDYYCQTQLALDNVAEASL